MGNSEYLVNTENNRIIYPYTLAENILSKDNQGNIILPDGNNKPIFGGSGIDPSTFMIHTINISGTRIPGNGSVDFPKWYPEAADGIYIISAKFIQNSFTSKPNSIGRYKLLRLYINTSIAIEQYYVESSTGYLFGSLITFNKLTKSDSIHVLYGNSIDGSTRTINSGSRIDYKLIRLCDIP